MRLIDADALFAKVPYGDIEHDVKISKCGAIADICTWILTAPTIDAVPVVRCSECKHWKKGDFQSGHSIDHMEWGGGCEYAQFARYESDFCSRGERRSDVPITI
jgi:hypothetical protein